VAAIDDRWYAGNAQLKAFRSAQKRWATVKNLIGSALLLGGLVLLAYCFGRRYDPWLSLKVAARISIMLGALVLIIPSNRGFGDFPRRRRSR
jgi:hypothetical protein